MEDVKTVIEAGKLAVGLLLLAGGVYTWYRVRKHIRLFSMAVFGTSSLKEGLEHQGEILAETPRSVTGMTRLCLPQIEADFPEFHWAQWRQMCENFLKAYLTALERQDTSALEEASEELKRQTRLEIEDQRQRGVRETYRQVKIHQTEIARYQKEAGLCLIRLQSAVEYYYEEKKTEDSREPAEAGGKKGKRKRSLPPGGPVKQQTRYNMELVYIQDIARVGDYATALGTVCPNCGAPITRLGSKFCEYCGTGVIPVDVRVWKLHRIEKE